MPSVTNDKTRASTQRITFAVNKATANAGTRPTLGAALSGMTPTLATTISSIPNQQNNRHPFRTRHQTAVPNPKVNWPAASKAVARILEVINDVSEKIFESEEDDEVIETGEEVSELSQWPIEKYQPDAYLAEMVKIDWHSENVEAVTVGLTMGVTFPITTGNVNYNALTYSCMRIIIINSCLQHWSKYFAIL